LDKESTLKVRVNPASVSGSDRDEVFITNEEPYVNRAVYAKPGLFRDGEISADEVANLEERSKAELARVQHKLEDAALVVTPPEEG
jgi:hypothetical protein